MASTPHARRRRSLIVMSAATAMALGLAGCGSSGGDGPTIASEAPSTISGDVQLWHFFTDREADVIQGAVDNFEKLYPDINVVVTGGQDDEKVLQAISAGQPVDVAISYSTDQVGPLCSSGAFIDLKPFIDRDKVDLSDIPEVAQSYTQYNGTRCTLPVLADAYALYYNTDMFAAAGITSPPKTLDELTEDAVKLTTYNADGSIKVLGFPALWGYYETTETNLSSAIQGKWLNDDGTSAIGSDPNWQTLYKWQADLVDKLGGFKKLSDFQAGLGEEFSSQQDFQTGRVAMAVDGEFRTAFIADQAPDLKYATAPTPVSSDHLAQYGGGYIAGNILGVGKGSTNPEAAWALVKYLALNTDAQVEIGNGLKNVPTITSALDSPNLEVDAAFKTFIDVTNSANSVTTPPSLIGAEYQTILNQFGQDWQSGTKTDLEAGLKDVDAQIDAAVALGGTGS